MVSWCGCGMEFWGVGWEVSRRALRHRRIKTEWGGESQVPADGTFFLRLVRLWQGILTRHTWVPALWLGTSGLRARHLSHLGTTRTPNNPISTSNRRGTGAPRRSPNGPGKIYGNADRRRETRG